MKPHWADWAFKPVYIIDLIGILAKTTMVNIRSLMNTTNLLWIYNIFLSQKIHHRKPIQKLMVWLMVTIIRHFDNFMYFQILSYGRHTFNSFRLWKYVIYRHINRGYTRDRFFSRIGKLWRNIDYNLSEFKFPKNDVFNCSTYPVYGALVVMTLIVEPT